MTQNAKIIEQRRSSAGTRRSIDFKRILADSKNVNSSHISEVTENQTEIRTKQNSPKSFTSHNDSILFQKKLTLQYGLNRKVQIESVRQTTLED